MISESKDLFGQAVIDYYNSYFHWRKIKVISSVSGTEKISPSYLFRSYTKMPLLEKKALEFSKGKILDVGACAGSHSLYLQNKGFDVTALDISPGCCKITEQRGVKKVICNDFFHFDGETFDTLLLLMNGIGIAGTLDKLKTFLEHCDTLLKPQGQIIFDSSDIDFIYHEKDGSRWINLNQNYYGEVRYQLKYRNNISDHFDWLFIDAETIEKIASEAGFSFSILAEGIHYDYLGLLKKL